MMPKKYILTFIILILAGLAALLIFFTRGDFFSASVIPEASSESYYINPYDMGATSGFTQPTDHPHEINLDALSTLETKKSINRGSLGTHVHTSTSNYSFKEFLSQFTSTYRAALEAVAVYGVRLYEGQTQSLLFNERKALYQYPITFEPGYDVHNTPEERATIIERVKAKQDAYPSDHGFTLDEFLELSKTRDITYEEPSRVILFLQSAFAYDPDDEQVHYILENPEKYFALVATQNAEAVQKIYDTHGEDIFDALYFEVGNEDYFRLPPRAHARVVFETTKLLKEIVPDIKVAFNASILDNGDATPPSMNNYMLGYIQDYYGVTDGSSGSDLIGKYTNEDVVRELSLLMEETDVRDNIVGVQLHSYSTAVVNSTIHALRNILDNNGFDHVKVWFDEYNFYGIWGDWNIGTMYNSITQFKDSYARNYLPHALSLITHPDILFADIHATPLSGFAESIANGIASTTEFNVVPHAIIDPFLAVYQNDMIVWRLLPAGIAQRLIHQVLLPNNSELAIKSLRFSRDIFDIFGFTEEDIFVGAIQNPTPEEKSYTLKSTSREHLNVLEVTFPQERNLLFSLDSIQDDLDFVITEIKESLPEKKQPYIDTIRQIINNSTADLGSLIADQVNDTNVENIISNSSFDEGDETAIGWAHSISPGSTSDRRVIEGDNVYVEVTNESMPAVAYMYQFSFRDIDEGDHYVAQAKVRKSTPESSMTLGIAQNPWNTQKQTVTIRKEAPSSTLTEATWTTVTTLPMRTVASQGSGDRFGVQLLIQGTVQIDDVQLINCTKNPTSSICKESYLSIRESIINDYLDSISWKYGQTAINDIGSVKEKSNALLRSLGLQELSSQAHSQIFGQLYKLYSYFYIERAISKYLDAGTTYEKALQLREVLRNILERSDPEAYIGASAAHVNRYLTYTRITSDFSEEITTIRSLLEEVLNPATIDAYIADLRLRFYPHLKLYKQEFSNEGNAIITLPKESIVLVSDEEIDADISDTLFESYPLIQSKITEGVFPETLLLENLIPEEEIQTNTNSQPENQNTNSENMEDENPEFCF